MVYIKYFSALRVTGEAVISPYRLPVILQLSKEIESDSIFLQLR